VTSDTTVGGDSPTPNGEALGPLLHSLRRTGRLDGLDMAMLIVPEVRKEYDRQFAGPMMSGPEARRVFSQAINAAEKAIKAAKRPGAAAGRGRTSPGK
jgi:hypothetical protein